MEAKQQEEEALFMNMNINDYREKPTCHVISICIGRRSECLISKILISYWNTPASTENQKQGPDLPCHVVWVSTVVPPDIHTSLSGHSVMTVLWATSDSQAQAEYSGSPGMETYSYSENLLVFRSNYRMCRKSMPTFHLLLF